MPVSVVQRESESLVAVWDIAVRQKIGEIALPSPAACLATAESVLALGLADGSILYVNRACLLL